MPELGTAALQFVLKVVSRCNLNCSYCYVYNKGDDSWRARPSFMSAQTLSHAVARMRAHCRASGQSDVRVTFHGGEPCLLGASRFAEFCEAVYSGLSDVCSVNLSLQTNGTLIDERWAQILAEYRVSVGLSLDGPEDINDTLRVDFRGRGTYDDIVRGLSLLRGAGVDVQILSVIHFGADGLRVHRHLLGLGVRRINYLFPDFTHDSVSSVFETYGETPCADYLAPILDHWASGASPETKVSPFVDMARVILGGQTYIDLIGNRPYQYCFVETDGAIEGLDVLRVCTRGLTATALNVDSDDFMAIAERSALHRRIMFEGLSLPSSCRACPERETCGGGYLPHRYSADRGFDNSSVWCRDLLYLFGRLRDHLGVSPEESRRRRAELSAQVAVPSNGVSAFVGYPPRAALTAEPVPSLVEIPPVLRWLGPDATAAFLHESWRRRAAAALEQLLIDAAEVVPDVVAECRRRLRALDGDATARVVMAPETTFRTVFRQSSAVDDVTFVERALGVERARVGAPAAFDELPAWCALGDVTVTESGEVRAAPTVAGLPPLDFESPFACRLDLSGIDYVVDIARPPLSGDAKGRVLQRLSAAADGLEATSGTVAAFVRTFTKVIIVQADGTGQFSSGTNGHYVGRAFLQNPQGDDVDECDLADAMVHESIHGLLSMHESNQPWVLSRELFDPIPRLVSPWSGTTLPVRPFLQACFVWYGLANFWAHAASRRSFPPRRCKDLLGRAAGGFLMEPLTRHLDAIRRGVSDDVVAAVAAMQDHIQTAFAEVA